ncbi:MAG TPA: hypothetical protein VIM88_09965 [Sulfurovum sp.]|uniref:hypothetical protein n=1 Tax=Sulfurovum sp. TaxID=1969726 RepID=UPI002F91D2C2
MLVGTGCDDVNISNIYSGTDQSTTHVSPTITVERYEVYFIKIYNSNGKNYDLTIDYDVDVSGLTEDDYNRPDFCYDYSYSQGATPLNITEPPGLVDTVTVGTPIDINLLIRNLGTVTGYRLAENAVVDITDINVSQAAYEADGILVKEARVFEFEYIPNIELDTSPTYINEIDVGDIPTMDKFTIRYQLVPKVSDLNLSINATIAYELAVPIGDTYVMTSHTFNLGDIGPCESMQTGYSPAYSIFNVELDSLNGPTANGEDRTYNLPTQTANRADNFEVVSYKVDDVFTTNPVSTIVGVELIEVLYDDIYESCADEDRAISPRIWLDFTGTETGTDTTHIPFNAATIQEAIENGSISDQIYPSLDGTPPISLPGDFYSSARENVAFRVVYNALKDGEELIRLIKTDQGLRIDNFEALVQDISSCKQEVKNPQNNTITSLVSVACSNDGNNLTQTEVATCMECLYGYNTRYLCSRDNFAIRPESFRVSLSDQSQVSPVTQSHIKTNVDNSRINIAAGYQYKVDVNATNYLNDHNTPGYGQTFSETNATADKHFSFVWNANSSINPNNCNDTRDHNKSMKFINGLMENNLSNDQIGEYNLTILDRDWTRNDHEPELLAHHYIHPIHGDVDEYFVTGDNARDCVVDSSHVPLEGASAGIDGGTITNVSGCDIKSKHTRNNGTVTEYTDINTMIYPYDFNLTGVQPQIGPYTRSNTHAPFVYINTPPTLDIDNKDMSYNMNGRFFAAGYNDVLLTNFVDGCYADDVNMSLNFIYNSPEPATDQEPYLSYSLKDHHTYDETEIYRPVPVSGYVLDNHFEVGTDTNNSTPFKILQEEEFFVKEMNGSISMDLGYNFKRDYNKTLNPRYIEFKDFNITHAINSNTPTNIYADLTNDHKIFGDKILDHNVTFVYGRAKPSQYLYDDVTEDFVDTPISMVVYCDQDPVTCGAVYNITNGTFRQTDEYDWYLSRGHVTDQGDGDITLNASTGANVELSDASPFPINFIDGVNTPDVRVSANAGTTRPLDVDITFVAPPNTDKWLIYNRDKNEIPVPFYRVRFIDESGWAGHGDTGHVVESETSTKKNRRLGW